MFKSKTPLPKLVTSKGCEGCSNRKCKNYGPSVSPEHYEHEKGMYSCNTSNVEDGVVIIFGGKHV